MSSPVSHAVCHVVTNGVGYNVQTRPDQTRVSSLTVSCSFYGLGRFRSNGYLPARPFGIGLER